MTIGWGHTGDVYLGQTITQEEADRLLFSRLATEFEPGVQQLAGEYCQNSDQFSALVCFAYNVGLQGLGESTLLKKFKAGDILGAADEFLRWNKADGKVFAGLTRRRQAERALFLSEDYTKFFSL